MKTLTWPSGRLLAAAVDDEGEKPEPEVVGAVCVTTIAVQFHVHVIIECLVAVQIHQVAGSSDHSLIMKNENAVGRKVDRSQWPYRLNLLLPVRLFEDEHCDRAEFDGGRHARI